MVASQPVSRIAINNFRMLVEVDGADRDASRSSRSAYR
jgi:hypothetical protein